MSTTTRRAGVLTGVAATVVLLLTPLTTPAATAQATRPECTVAVDTTPPSSPPQPADAPDHRDLATGAGVRVAVIDTGVAPHPELGEVTAVGDLVGGARIDPLFDCDGHGTVVAGVIAGDTSGVAPDAEILSVRQTSALIPRATPGGTDDPAGPEAGDAAQTSGTLSSLAEAIHLALDADADLINISVVACVPREIAVRLDSGVLDEALRRAEEQQVVVVAAAGNLSEVCAADSVVYPTHSASVLGVGARATAHELAEYSLPLPPGQPALSAPAHVAHGLSPTGPGWVAAVGTPGGQPEEFHGTSFAAPVVTGAAALLKQRYPHYSAAELRAHLIAASQPAGGAVDPAAAVSFVPPDTGTNLSTDRREVTVPSPTPADSPVRPRAGQLLAGLGALALLGAVFGGLRTPRPQPPRPGKARTAPTPGTRGTRG